MLTQGSDKFAFQDMPYHLDDELVDNIKSLLELHALDSPRKLELLESHTKLLPYHISLKLKPSSKNIECACLRDNESLPIIISNALTLEHGDKLIRVLREHTEALRWTSAIP